jgi:hypothetical protein
MRLERIKNFQYTPSDMLPAYPNYDNQRLGFTARLRTAAPSERTRPANVFSALVARFFESSLPATVSSRRLGGFSGVVLRPVMLTPLSVN